MNNEYIGIIKYSINFCRNNFCLRIDLSSNGRYCYSISGSGSRKRQKLP